MSSLFSGARGGSDVRAGGCAEAQEWPAGPRTAPQCCRAGYRLPVLWLPSAGFFQKHRSLSQQTAKSE